VAGSKMIQSQTVMYDFGDFPIYAMAAIVIGLALAAIAFFGGRGLILNIKGRELKMKLDHNPIWLQIYSTGLLLIAYIYMNEATKSLIPVLQINNYVIDYGPSFDFLLGSIIAMSLSVVMTTVKYLKTKNNIKTDTKPNVQKA
jgi:hypothetical protein